MRNANDQQIIDRGKMYAEFKNTLYWKDLNGFIDEQERLAKESMMENLMHEDPQTAASAAKKLSGILSVRTYVDESIMNMMELMDLEKNEREAKKCIPGHV